jgi:hypothetical protein
VGVSPVKLLAYVLVGVLVGFCVEAFAQPLMIATFRDLEFAAAVRLQLSDGFGDPIVLVVKLLPFVGLGVLAAWADRKDGRMAAVVSLLAYAFVLTLTYLLGFYRAESIFKQGYPTAAALNAGLPFIVAILSLPAFPLVSAAVRRLIGPRGV